MNQALLAAASSLLVVELLLVATAAWAGGASVALIRLGHRRMQVLLSFTGGILLGVAMLHLLPHAARALGGSIDATAPWLLAGFFLMFLLERGFHGHAHHAVDPDHGPASGCDHDSHRHGSTRHDGHGALPSGPPGTQWGWLGAFVGLAIHSLADGAALAAAAERGAGAGGFFAGGATFLAILLHKPIDAALIAALMVKAGATTGLRTGVNLLHAALVPIGALAFVVVIGTLGVHRGETVGAALALAAGAFLCIAAADLLPEVEFHSHDRLLLSAALALGITVAAGITGLERFSRAEARAGRATAADAIDIPDMSVP